MKYYINKILKADFETSLAKVIESLKNEGFGVLTEINIKDKLKEKLDVDFRKYIILGACNPPFAYKALMAEDKIGVMLPCNVVLQELSKGETEVFAIDPAVAMQAIQNNEVEKIAMEIKEKLSKVIDNL